MKKIATLFQRNYDTDRLVRNDVTPGAEWVLNGEGVATKKYDGTCCLVRDGKLYKRHELRKGKTPPPNFEPVTEMDEITGKQQGWIPVDESNPEDKWHIEAWKHYHEVEEGFDKWGDGTYELCGPKIQGNPEGFSCHVLIPHPYVRYIADPRPRTFESIRDWIIELNESEKQGIEGIVYWRNLNDPDCDKVKIKLKDFGIKRNKK